MKLEMVGGGGRVWQQRFWSWQVLADRVKHVMYVYI